MPDDARRSIVLVGYRGSGKTTVGRLLADALALPFLDTDDMVVEAAGASIADIFAVEGEASFRDRESLALTAAIERSPAVISAGGGAVVRAANRELLRSRAWVVWLTAPPELLLARTQADPMSTQTRPALTRSGGIEEIRTLLTTRTPLYESCANLTIDTQHRSPAEVADVAADWHRTKLKS